MLTLDVLAKSPPPGLVTGRLVNTWYDDAGQLCTRFFVDGNRGWVDWYGLGVFEFERGRSSVRVWPAPDAAAEVIADTFERVLQPAILQAMGWQAVHASAVAGPGGVLAFCGRAHSGKSTIAFAVARAGFSQIADDALVLRLEGDVVAAHPLPFSARLRPASRAHFSRHASAPAGGSASRPALPSVTPVSAFFVLRQDAGLNGPEQLVRIVAAQAFSELLTHAHCFDPSDPAEARRLVDAYLEIARRVPVFALTYRPGFEDLPALLDLIVAAAGVRMDDGAVVHR